jgi:predicted RNase H-like nuclease (RuvC/YqgF family)
LIAGSESDTEGGHKVVHVANKAKHETAINKRRQKDGAKPSKQQMEQAQKLDRSYKEIFNLRIEIDKLEREVVGLKDESSGLNSEVSSLSNRLKIAEDKQKETENTHAAQLQANQIEANQKQKQLAVEIEELQLARMAEEFSEAKRVTMNYYTSVNKKANGAKGAFLLNYEI